MGALLDKFDGDWKALLEHIHQMISELHLKQFGPPSGTGTSPSLGTSTPSTPKVVEAP